MESTSNDFQKVLIDFKDLKFPFGDWRDECNQVNPTPSSFEIVSEDSSSEYFNKSNQSPEDSEMGCEVKTRNRAFSISKRTSNNDFEFDVTEDTVDKTSHKRVFSVTKVHRHKSESKLEQVVDEAIIYKKANKSANQTRLDVVNKWILRAFRKYLKRLVATHLVSKEHGGDSESPLAKIVDDIDNFCPHNNHSEMYEILGWVYNPKKASGIHKANPTIKLLDKIYSSYSHKKLNLVFGNKSLKSLFWYFCKNGRDFLFKLPSVRNRCEYEKALSEFKYFFSIRCGVDK